MRIWTLHPKYLDQKRLCGQWTEGVLALKVIAGETTAYENHPQLDRFKDSLGYVSLQRYLYHVYRESTYRGFKFNPALLRAPISTLQGTIPDRERIAVSHEQVAYEYLLLMSKVSPGWRDNNLMQYFSYPSIRTNYLFYLDVNKAGIALWERPKKIEIDFTLKP